MNNGSKSRALMVQSLSSLFIIVCLLFLNCSGESKKSGRVSKSDTTALTENNSSYFDSICIVSPDGKLIDIIRYHDCGNCDDYRNYIKGYPHFDTLTGDFNGDGTQEHAWIEGDYHKYLRCQEKGDKESCRGIIQFSDNKIRPLVVDYCPFGSIKNEGVNGK